MGLNERFFGLSGRVFPLFIESGAGALFCRKRSPCLAALFPLFWEELEETMPVTKTTAKTAVASKSAKKTAKKVTIDDVWAGFERLEKLQESFQKDTQKAQKESEEKAQKSRDETWKAIKETQNEAWKAIKESQDEAWKAIKETQRNIGGLNNTLGSLVERIMTPDLPRKFTQFGFAFNRITTVKWAVEGSIYAEIDGLLENGTQAMVVEVKTTLREKDIDEHLIRMDKVRAFADDHGDKRQFLGAMAATIVGKAAKEYALSKGFFVIEPSGENVKVTKPVYDPKVW
jgi:hypothetical protein